MRNAFLIFLIFSSFIAKAQSDSIKGNVYFLKGKIINHISLTPDCGIIAFGTVIEYEIITFSDTTYTDKNIGLIFPCPELYKDNFFKVGKIYEITVADKNQATFNWTIPNENLLKKYNLKNKFWVITANKIK